MSTVNIDVKGLSHTEKESRIFPAIEKLGSGDKLHITLDFNPSPLAYMLETRPDLQVEQLGNAGGEWAIDITRINKDDSRKSVFKGLLKELKSGHVSSEAKERARKVLQTIDARTLGILEQELIEEGVSQEEIRTGLCDIHLEVMRDALVEKRIEVKAPHPVHTLMSEHQVILDYLKKLDGLLLRIQDFRNFEEAGELIAELHYVAHHLTEAERHHQREEDVLFPYLEKHDIREPSEIMRVEHVEFRARKQQLLELAANPRNHSFDEFREKVTEAGRYLVAELESHIFKEDNILYQMALQTFTAQEWEEVKAACDRIGYCCFTPGVESGSSQKTVELDIRKLSPWERHPRIFSVWDELQSGDSIRIINDHDPKPLYYQMEAEAKGTFSWRYDQKGPVDWVFTMTKL